MTDLYKSIPVKSSEITPHSLYLSRRDFLKAAGIVTGSALLVSCAPKATENEMSAFPVKKDEVGDPANSFEDITHYNNFYEFSENKEAVNRLSKNFKSHPWTVEVYGLVNHPKKYAIEDLLKKFDQEERIYRLRCVEAWSMVIPWIGFPLKKLLDQVVPLGNAKYVSFQTAYDPKSMQSSFSAGIDLPYVEGLRLDEAMHPLTILATGLYGKQMPNQNGAPIRLVVPWKYGFKSIKSIVKITLTEEIPPTTWNIASPD